MGVTRVVKIVLALILVYFFEKLENRTPNQNKDYKK